MRTAHARSHLRVLAIFNLQALAFDERQPSTSMLSTSNASKCRHSRQYSSFLKCVRPSGFRHQMPPVEHRRVRANRIAISSASCGHCLNV